MNYYFHPEADAELNHATKYYEKCAVALGLDFAIEVFSSIERIIAHPKAWPVLEDDIRRCQTRRFPYGVLYSIEPNGKIYILAIMHLQRSPEYWKSRLK